MNGRTEFHIGSHVELLRDLSVGNVDLIASYSNTYPQLRELSQRLSYPHPSNPDDEPTSAQKPLRHESQLSG